MTTDENPPRASVRMTRFVRGCSLATLAILLVAIGSCAAAPGKKDEA